jgi:hypothetical protein
LILLALAAGGFAATNWFLKGPRWALYQVGKAVHERNPSLFVAYVDAGRILSGQKDDIVDLLLPDQNRAEQRDFLRGIITAFMGTLTEQVNQQIIRIISDPQRENLPSSWTLAVAARIDTNGDSALATLADPQSGRNLRLGLRRGEDGRWRVVEINSQDLKTLINEYVLNKRDQGKSPAAAAPAPAAPSAPSTSPAPAPPAPSTPEASTPEAAR